MKHGVSNYVGDPTLIKGAIGLCGGSWRMREISLYVTFFFPFFFNAPLILCNKDIKNSKGQTIHDTIIWTETVNTKCRYCQYPHVITMNNITLQEQVFQQDK